jgi:hypothetical protein
MAEIRRPNNQEDIANRISNKDREIAEVRILLEEQKRINAEFIRNMEQLRRAPVQLRNGNEIENIRRLRIPVSQRIQLLQQQLDGLIRERTRLENDQARLLRQPMPDRLAEELLLIQQLEEQRMREIRQGRIVVQEEQDNGQEIEQGDNNDNNIFSKYLKYKTKYLNLKNNIN